ncbi:hypothetical protein [Listeria cornellensis]|uniref:Yip1 domain-containing protein n=1 Tax=Listeria cornellensis FSL F6-0969 TaxID=1265820 RepID=W7CAD1_9LIST|nr:hypothetical protein [Listeria cornellensis]EUJ29688.1 hypothetical protein PCORN_11162 [Listeria cornellensis FSL F6-0969]
MIRDYFSYVGMTIVRPVKTSMQASQEKGAFGLFHVLLFVIGLSLQYSWNMKGLILSALQEYPILQKVVTAIFVSSGQIFIYIFILMLLNITVSWVAIRYVMGIKEVTFMKSAAGIGGMITFPLVIILVSIIMTCFGSVLISVLLCLMALLFLPYAIMYFIIGHYEKSRIDVYWVSILVFVVVTIITLTGVYLLIQVFMSNVHDVISQIQHIINERWHDFRDKLPI